MAQPRRALALLLLLLLGVALPAQARWPGWHTARSPPGTRPARFPPTAGGAAAGQHRAGPEEGWQALPGPGESPGALHQTEYGDGSGKSAEETPEVLREILRELKVVQRGVNGLRLSSAVSRRSPGAGDNESQPEAAAGRADPDVVDADSFQKYCVEGIVAVLGSMLLGMVLCCALHVWRKRRK